jgi:hypothetical protein
MRSSLGPSSRSDRPHPPVETIGASGDASRSSRLARFAGIGVAASLLAFGEGRARADDAPEPDRVLLLVDDPRSPFATRLGAELAGLGLQPIFDKPSGDPPTSLDEEASSHGAAAAIRLERSDHALEIWVADQVTGKTSLRKLSLGSERDPALTATKAVELLRASLLEARLEPPEKHAKPKLLVDKVVPSEVVPKPPGRTLGALELAPGLLLSPGGLPPAVTVQMRGGYLPTTYVELLASLWVPTGSVSFTVPEGRSAQLFLLGTVGARVHLAGADRILDPTLGLGLGLSWVHGDGSAAKPYRGETQTLVSMLAIADAGLGLRLASTFGLRADGGCGPVLPRPVFVVAGRQAASWGFPVCTASLGLRVSFRE